MNYDPFQLEAIETIKAGRSVLVSAPTGSGKTAIAEFLMDLCLKNGEQVIYTAPLKALSNQKFREFQKIFPDRVGILTGDVSLNASAPLLIMTTEIFHNQLLEEMIPFDHFSWIIFDEVHYLDDLERGTIWEESLLFMPPHMKILALSATIPNCQAMADWFNTVLQHPISLVREDQRPVPLDILFQCRGRIVDDLRQVRRIGYGRRSHLPGKGRSLAGEAQSPNRVTALLAHLARRDRLPCIYFAFSRKRCEYLAGLLKHLDFLSDRERDEVLGLYDQLCRRFELSDDPTALAMREHVARGAAYHHAGLRPAFKEVIERLFTSRLIKVIFATETFSLGINMPARTVAFDELRKIYGNFHRTMRTRDFHQMAGRAGRRGIDEQGYAYLRINPLEVSYPELEKMIHGAYEPIQSQFKPAYATLLNLYEKYGERLYEIYPYSFHYYQEKQQGRNQALAQMRSRLELLIQRNFIRSGSLTEKGHFGKKIFGYELLLSELYGNGALEMLNREELAQLCLALVFEPRRAFRAPTLRGSARDMHRLCRRALQPALNLERRLGINPLSKPPFFHLSEPLLAWMQGGDFNQIIAPFPVDEGEVIRSFRMAVQVLRALLNTSLSPAFKEIAQRAIDEINRGVIDAEMQLRHSIENGS